MSSSYAPSAGSDGHASLIQALEAAFDRYAEAGVVTIPYTTTIIGGALSAVGGPPRIPRCGQAARPLRRPCAGVAGGQHRPVVSRRGGQDAGLRAHFTSRPLASFAKYSATSFPVNPVAPKR